MELPRTPSTRLDGRRALVTGAGRGIGLACAAALAQAGAHVVLVARTTSEVEEVAQAIRRDGGTAEAITLDITDLGALNESLNLRAAFFTAQAVARRMVEFGKRGSIINVSSQMGLVGGPNRTVYCATKHGMEGMTKAMAVDLGPHGIRINTICPTFVETPLVRRFLADEAIRSWIVSRIKLGRIGQVEELMGAVVFLASDASSLMTGSAMVVDGGWTAD
jgi:NAD(P)-dependent dehydrogenase (short-subunit alcohol dehydrogenase family)